MNDNRFDGFNPTEREILRVLLSSHLNAVSEIAITAEVRVANYLIVLEKLEAEANGRE